MIVEYHRPNNLEDAVTLIARKKPPTRPLGGGTVLNQPNPEAFAVGDLQDLGLNRLHKRGNNLEAGATATLQALLARNDLPEALARAIRLEASHNLRQTATLGGLVASADGRSALLSALLALDCKATVLPGPDEYPLGELLPLRAERLKQRLISRLLIPFHAQLAFEAVARTPSDRPIVSVALARWASGRTRLTVGGWGPIPVLAMDGGEPGEIEMAARNACANAADEWASSEYRAETAAILARRCLNTLSA